VCGVGRQARFFAALAVLARGHRWHPHWQRGALLLEMMAPEHAQLQLAHTRTPTNPDVDSQQIKHLCLQARSRSRLAPATIVAPQRCKHACRLTSGELCRAVGRLRTAMKEPSEALPVKIQQAAQQKRLQAAQEAVVSMQAHVAALRAVAARYFTNAGAPPAEECLLTSLLSAAPDVEHAAWQLVESLSGATAVFPVVGSRYNSPHMSGMFSCCGTQETESLWTWCLPPTILHVQCSASRRVAGSTDDDQCTAEAERPIVWPCHSRNLRHKLKR
jgi:hypothetical protein